MSIFSNFSFNFFNPSISLQKSFFDFSSLKSLFWRSSSFGSRGITWGGSETDPSSKLDTKEPIDFGVMQNYGIMCPKESKVDPLTVVAQDYGIQTPTGKSEDPTMIVAQDYGIVCPKATKEEKPAEMFANYGIVCFIDSNRLQQ